MKRISIVALRHCFEGCCKEESKKAPNIIRSRRNLLATFGILLCIAACSLSGHTSSVISVVKAASSLQIHQQQQTQGSSSLHTRGTKVISDDGSSIESLMEFISDNYLTAGEPSRAYLSMNSVISDDHGTFKSFKSIRPQQLVDLKDEGADWWTNLTFGPKHSVSSSSQRNLDYPDKRSRKIRPSGGSIERGSGVSAESPEYMKQPMKQNAIKTILNQLAALRAKHRLLVTKSIRQLQQLDQKLNDSYKLCLKRKLLLYASLLYKTRDFVTKMAKEVKRERVALEARIEKTQGTLRQLMINETSVKPTDKLIAASNTPIFHDGVFVEAIGEKKPKPKYNVKVGEVNLRKELSKVQTLIDRINGSSYELKAVADDIICLFELNMENSNKRDFSPYDKLKRADKIYKQAGETSSYSGNQNPSSTDGHKRTKKLLKSPMRIIYERFGKPTMVGDTPVNVTGANNSRTMTDSYSTTSQTPL